MEPPAPPAPEPVSFDIVHVTWACVCPEHVVPEPVVVVEEPEPVASGLDRRQAEAALAGVLDTLGQAHHRPFSRG